MKLNNLTLFVDAIGVKRSRDGRIWNAVQLDENKGEHTIIYFRGDDHVWAKNTTIIYLTREDCNGMNRCCVCNGEWTNDKTVHFIDRKFGGTTIRTMICCNCKSEFPVDVATHSFPLSTPSRGRYIGTDKG